MRQLLNYTTGIAVEKTVGEIQQMLAEAGATSIMCEYDDERIMKALSFRIKTAMGVMTFQLPANIDKVLVLLQGKRSRVPKWNQTRAQAARVGWRILKDWLAAQLAIIQTNTVSLDQVMLAFAQDNTGVTIYESLQAGRIKGYALTESKA